jgi:two-component system, LuxR family, sensor kinase FixL
MTHSALLLLEFGLLAIAALALHRMSPRHGLAPLLAFLSGLAVFSQVTNYVYVVVGEPRVVVNASVLYVPVIFMAVLVLYAVEGTVAARQAVLAILGLSLLVFYAAVFNRVRLEWLGGQSIAPLVPGQSLVTFTPAIVACSIAAFAVGLSVVVVTHQFVCSRAPGASAWLAPGAAILAGLWVDSIVFSLLHGLPTGGAGPRLQRDLFGKTAAGVLLWPLASAYLARLARHGASFAGREPRPVFDLLFGATGRIERDLSRVRRDLRQERDLVARLAETSPVAIVRLDRGGVIAFANAQAESLLRLTAAEIRSRRYDSPEWRITSEEGGPYPPGSLPFSRVRETGQPVHDVRHALTWPDGSRTLISVHAAPLPGPAGEFDGVVAILEDITERRRREIEREALVQQLERQNQELERFTYTVSHDLKSPLITIRGFLGMLTRSARAGDMARLEGDIRRIDDATSRMDVLLRDLLEMSRIGRAMNPPEAVPFEAVAREALELTEGTVRQKGARVRVAPGLPVVYGDRVRLVEVVQNLVDNAVKFAQPGVPPEIEIGAGQHAAGDGLAQLFVRDNGIGIEPRFQERVFGLFDKLEPKSEGSGVGLALVKRIVGVHGGRIWVESEGPGRGSTFCFTLPRPGERSEPGVPARPGDAPQGPRA